METLVWEGRPVLRRPLLVTAFEGWNDAGDAASMALSYLVDAWGAQRFATVDPEEFFDFTDSRPHTRIAEGLARTIEWPAVDVLHAKIPGADRDVIFVRGVEPQLRWRTFCAAIVDVAGWAGAELAVSLGALLADVPHTRPVRVTGTTDDPGLSARLGLVRSNYEGPTGIVGVLASACAGAGIPSASFWAAVPHYVHQVPSPKAALALVRASAAVLGARVDPLALQVAAEEYERQVSERVADDEDAAAYVAHLEEADDSSGGAGAFGGAGGAGAFGGAGGAGAFGGAGREGGAAGAGGVEAGRPAGLGGLDPEGLAAQVERYLRDHRADG